MKSRNLPVMTRDGLTCVENCYAVFDGVHTRIRPEQRIEHILSLVAVYELTFFGAIIPWKPAELWEYVYLCEGTRPFTLEGWHAFVDARNKKEGLWEIRGNFVEISHVWSLETRDVDLVARFREALAAQPESYHQARRDWEARCEESFAPRRARFASIQPEEYFRELENKRKARQGF